MEIGNEPTGSKVLKPLLAVIATLALSEIFIADFMTYEMPWLIVGRLYLYAGTGIIIASTAILILHEKEKKSLLPASQLQRRIALILGSLWILDGILQLQPEMAFGFAAFVLTPVAMGSPEWLQPALNSAIATWAAHQVLFDAMSACLQIFIGLGMIVLKSRRNLVIFSAISFVWAILIWIFGEGLGEIFSPGFSFITGFPGSALIYAIMSFFIMQDVDETVTVKRISVFMVVLFTLSALIQALPWNIFWLSGSISHITYSLGYNAQPRPLVYLMFHAADILAAGNTIWNIVFTLFMVLIAISWLKNVKIASLMTAILTSSFWFIGQDFGIFGGYGTDPNTALPIIFLALIMFQSGKNGLRSNVNGGNPVPLD
ncbi:MAG: hypothetical protein M1344_01475 [Candidatus Thermoplasmatota archaeon]|nr:hypothetical protein [Candidatus Thermoplasmatota archaeon]